MTNGLSWLALVQIIARRNWLVDPQRIPEGLSVLANALCRLPKPSIVDLDVRISTCTIALVLNGLRVDVWLLESLIESLVL